jgi:hypothetical protein
MAKQAYVYSGTDWVPLASEVTNLTAYQTKALAQAPYRNLLINGDMQVAQRATSAASITTDGYRTVDRYYFGPNSMGTWTMSQENDAPSGSGFRQSAKVLCTTADASPAAGDYVLFVQRIEGQNLQHLKKGTASAEQLTLSFWVKSNVTGTYIAELQDYDNTRQVSKSYTVSASGVWERKTITFPADTTGVLDNDNNTGIALNMWLGAGSTFTSGTLNSSSWAGNTDANRTVGQVNLASATNNYWQVTGVQLEVGDTATPFEFKPYAQDLEECQRYYYRLTTVNSGDALTGFGESYATTVGQTVSYAPQVMRATATTVDYANIGWITPSTGSGSITSLTLPLTGTIGNVIFLSATTGSGMGSGKVFYIRSTSAGGYIGIGCEL